MNSYEAARRLLAHSRGHPLPRGSTLHFPLEDVGDALRLAFVRMGGESAPWGIAWRSGRQAIQCLTAAEPRDRNELAEIAVSFAPVLLGWVHHPEFARERRVDPTTGGPHRQIWLPNQSHVEMLHYLDYMYTRTRWKDEDRRKLLRTFGRACGWLFRESQRPGQVRVMVASAALRESFTFPAEDVRQAHLGYLLAWLQTPGPRDARLAAAAVAERSTIGTTLDPEFERAALVPLVEVYGSARRDEKTAELTALRRKIHDTLVPELHRRIELTEQAIDLLRSDTRPVNPGVARLTRTSRAEHLHRYLAREQQALDEGREPFPISPETDRQPAAAASGYQRHLASADQQLHSLIHHDEEMQREAIADGWAIRGTIVQVVNEGVRRRIQPIWTVEHEGNRSLSLRPGDRVCVAGLPSRWGTIRSVNQRGDHARTTEIAIGNWKKARPAQRIPAATDSSLVGKELTLLPTSAEDLLTRKGQRSWREEGPGAWLTHRRPRTAAAAAEAPADAGHPDA